MEKTILVEVSARHVHVTQEHLEILFGKGYELTFKKALSQPGQFAANERVRVVGPKNEFPAVSILGPVRKATQVEISMTDARTIGVNAPIRESGYISGSAACTIIGPNGQIELKEGVIVAKRHVHVTPADAEKFGVKNQDIVSVKIETPERSTVYNDVVIRVRDDFATAMHIDTDEGNAAGVGREQYGTIL